VAFHLPAGRVVASPKIAPATRVRFLRGIWRSKTGLPRPCTRLLLSPSRGPTGAWIKALKVEGRGATEIGDEVGCSRRAVYKVLGAA
jgi:hypothetical protein